MNDNENEKAEDSPVDAENLEPENLMGFVPMDPEQLWRTAQKYHEQIIEEVQSPGDMIGIAAILFTNTLIAGAMSGVDVSIITDMLHLIRLDVERGIESMSKQTIQ